CREEDVSNSRSAEQNLNQPHGAKRMRNRKNRREEVDIQGRDEVQAVANKQVSTHDAPSKGGIDSGVKTGIRLGQDVPAQLHHRSELQQENRYQEQSGMAPARAPRFG